MMPLRPRPHRCVVPARLLAPATPLTAWVGLSIGVLTPDRLALVPVNPGVSMGDRPVERRLTAILAADVVGYSRLMEVDEVGTLATLKALRKDILEPLAATYKGRIFKIAGDAALLEFASPVNAVQCAIDLQNRVAVGNDDVPGDRQVNLRIGINLGDVLVEGNDLYGDGVNIAARLESLAEPGGIWISQSVQEQVKRKLPNAIQSLGPQRLKNIAEPVIAYRVQTMAPARTAERVPLPEKPSIAILPFTNMSGEPDQEAFSDGLTEDLITDLSRNGGLFVIARNSTFAFKGRSVDARRIAGELGVRYLLEGSARRQGGRVRINVQLIDAEAGGHLWAERFDREIQDVFAVQDEVTARIVEALVGQLAVQPARYRPKNMEAHDLCVRGRALHEQSPAAAREGFLMLQRAIQLDPAYAEAHAWLAQSHWIGWAHWGWSEAEHRPAAFEVAQKAVALDPTFAGCHWILGMIYAYERQWRKSEDEFATALKLDPNCADAWAELSDTTVLAGRIEEGLEHIRKAFRLNPYPASWYFLLLGQAQYAARDYAAAIDTLRREETYRYGSRRFLAAALAQAGRLDEAKYEAEMFMLSNPHFTIGHWVRTMPLRDDAVEAHFREGYRKAGLPE